jgi:hypothetical protein
VEKELESQPRLPGQPKGKVPTGKGKDTGTNPVENIFFTVFLRSNHGP